MFLKLINFLFKSTNKLVTDVDKRKVSLQKANELFMLGDKHAAVIAFKAYLKTDPYNIQVLNDLGACFADIGNVKDSIATFELAYSLDDNFMPVVVNHAKMLNDSRRSTEAMPLLKQAKVSDPNFSHTDAVYGDLRLKMGDLVSARYFHLRSWLANFDNLRLANCHLFTSAYADIDELQLAAEHRFWADTVRKIDIPNDFQVENNIYTHNIDQITSKKIKIGYWSSDFRSHSVRYFFRPLLEGHDQTKFEIFLYHDFPMSDVQTEHIKSAGTHFYEVCEMSDIDLFKFIKSQQLDIFVELTGHSSHNRVSLLQHRFATVQFSALGYPPTTGLCTLDAKLLDRHVMTSDSHRYYSESPLALPTSFWCFDPMEDAPIALEPPVIRNGYITFGCVGNIAKINSRILRCWRVILNQVPTSRFLIRAINFEDTVAEHALLERLINEGLDVSRVQLCKPEGGVTFFESYNEIDIILDTYPFNGGTTTCFATYMGVPVISWAGASLISRMGLSILSNLDASDLVVTDTSAYIARAISLSQDISAVQRFKREARARYKKSSLGNGKLFAHEFEQACKILLDQKQSGSLVYHHDILPLPADEIMRRAYAVLRTGQVEAVQRILSHCLQHYPDNGSAHLLSAHLLASKQQFKEAVNYLLERFHKFTSSEQIATLISVVRMYMLMSRNDHVAEIVNKLALMDITDSFDKMQVQLYRSCCAAEENQPSQPATSDVKHFHILIPCDESDRFDEMCSQIKASCFCPNEWIITYERCNESTRITAYESALMFMNFDILILIQKNISLHNPLFFIEINKALDESDMVGFAGAKCFKRIDWRSDVFQSKAAGFLVPSSEINGFVEIQCLGIDPGTLVSDMQVLDGSLLALKRSNVNIMFFDKELISAETILEEDWVHTCFQAGLRLNVHRNLGVMVDQKIELDSKYRSTGRMHFADKHGFDPFLMLKDDNMMVSAPVTNVNEAIKIMNIFLKEAA
ncbi:MAG: hypothetical protein PHF58_12800 [Methylotenera sp.]|nr:hypothetical protein [Methylotenera sp.]